MEVPFSKNLKLIRENIGLTKSQLAKKMGVNQSTVSRWESGKMGITIDNAYELSLILGVSLPQLVGKNIDDINDNINRKYQYTKVIYDNNGYSIEIKTPIPFDKISEDEQQKIVDNALKELLYIKKEVHKVDK